MATDKRKRQRTEQIEGIESQLGARLSSKRAIPDAQQFTPLGGRR